MHQSVRVTLIKSVQKPREWREQKWQDGGKNWVNNKLNSTQLPKPRTDNSRTLWSEITKRNECQREKGKGRKRGRGPRHWFSKLYSNSQLSGLDSLSWNCNYVNYFLFRPPPLFSAGITFNANYILIFSLVEGINNNNGGGGWTDTDSTETNTTQKWVKEGGDEERAEDWRRRRRRTNCLRLVIHISDGGGGDLVQIAFAG